jgi:hypothetical protein
MRLEKAGDLVRPRKLRMCARWAKNGDFRCRERACPTCSAIWKADSAERLDYLLRRFAGEPALWVRLSVFAESAPGARGEHARRWGNFLAYARRKGWLVVGVALSIDRTPKRGRWSFNAHRHALVFGATTIEGAPWSKGAMEWADEALVDRVTVNGEAFYTRTNIEGHTNLETFLRRRDLPELIGYSLKSATRIPRRGPEGYDPIREWADALRRAPVRFPAFRLPGSD